MEQQETTKLVIGDHVLVLTEMAAGFGVIIEFVPMYCCEARMIKVRLDDKLMLVCQTKVVRALDTLELKP